MHRFLLWACLAVFAMSDPARAQDPARSRPPGRVLGQFAKDFGHDPRSYLRAGSAWLLEREATLRLLSILSGTRPTGDAGNGWLVPSRSRYTWSWLAQRADRDGDGVVSAQEYDGPSDGFRSLDRDRDGSITPVDLDWSPKSPLAKAGNSAKMMFRSIDADGNGQVTSDEWQSYMDKLALGKAYLSQDDLLPLFHSAGKAKSRPDRDDGKINPILFRAYLEGDVGSLFEGPRPGTRAPDFTLPTSDGKGAITLSNYFGKRPVVLVFGSFT